MKRIYKRYRNQRKKKGGQHYRINLNAKPKFTEHSEEMIDELTKGYLRGGLKEGTYLKLLHQVQPRLKGKSQKKYGKRAEKKVLEIQEKHIKELSEEPFMAGEKSSFKIKNKKTFSAGIPLRDPRKYEFGSIEWQGAMVHNIKEKMKRGEELGPAEKTFLGVQKEHTERIQDRPSVFQETFGQGFSIPGFKTKRKKK